MQCIHAYLLHILQNHVFGLSFILHISVTVHPISTSSHAIVDYRFLSIHGSSFYGIIGNPVVRCIKYTLFILELTIEDE
jgi:hypothetical protein